MTTSVSQTLPATPRTSVKHLLTVLCQRAPAPMISILSRAEPLFAFMITSHVLILSLIRTIACLISSSTMNPMLATMTGPVELMVPREISQLKRLISIHAEKNAPTMKSARVTNTLTSLVNVNITGSVVCRSLTKKKVPFLTPLRIKCSASGRFRRRTTSHRSVPAPQAEVCPFTRSRQLSLLASLYFRSFSR